MGQEPADLSAPEAHLHSNGCIPLQQELLAHLVPPVGCLEGEGGSVAAPQLCICGAGLPALHLGLDGDSSPALPQEGSAVGQHAPCALDGQH